MMGFNPLDALWSYVKLENWKEWPLSDKVSYLYKAPVAAAILLFVVVQYFFYSMVYKVESLTRKKK